MTFPDAAELDLTRASSEEEETHAWVSEHLVKALEEKNVRFELDLVREFGLDSTEAIGRRICALADNVDAAAIVVRDVGVGAAHGLMGRDRGFCFVLMHIVMSKYGTCSGSGSGYDTYNTYYILI